MASLSTNHFGSYHLKGFSTATKGPCRYNNSNGWIPLSLAKWQTILPSEKHWPWGQINASVKHLTATPVAETVPFICCQRWFDFDLSTQHTHNSSLGVLLRKLVGGGGKKLMPTLLCNQHPTGDYETNFRLVQSFSQTSVSVCNWLGCSSLLLPTSSKATFPEFVTWR